MTRCPNEEVSFTNSLSRSFPYECHPMTSDIGFISERSLPESAYSVVSVTRQERSLKNAPLKIPQSATAGFITGPESPPSQMMNSLLHRFQYFPYAQV